jgi:hypothetical protein
MTPRLSILLAVAAAACSSGRADTRAVAHPDGHAARAGHRYVLCSMVTKEEMQAVTGEPYTVATSDDDPHSTSTSSSCHYATSADPVPLVVELSWLSDEDAADPATRATMARIPINVARKGTGFANTTAGLPAGASLPGFQGRDVPGLGDEAYFGLGTLTVRAGDNTIRIFMYAEPMAMIKDSTVGRDVVEHEKAIARVVLTKL